MEILDIYNKEGERKGITVFRGEYINPDDYILVSHIYIYNENKEFLIQRRSWKKKVNSGKWDITGGAVKAGETSKEAAIRETREEIGLEIPRERLKFIHRHVSIKHIVDIYFVKLDFSIKDCKLQEEEVAEVKLVPLENLVDVLHRSDFQDTVYNGVIKNQIEKILNNEELTEGNPKVNFSYNEKLMPSLDD